MPNWKKIIVSGSDATLNSLTVENGITGSITTASLPTRGVIDGTVNQNIITLNRGDGTSITLETSVSGSVESASIASISTTVRNGGSGSFNGTFTGSALLTSASIGHLETIYETASVIYSSGSTKFGDTSDDTHEYTGSLFISGGISIVEGAQLTGTSSFATTASHALNVPDTASHALTAVTASHTSGTASIADLATTASYTDGTASFADSATTASHTAGTASIANSAVTASHTTGTASISNNATSASYSLTGDGVFSGSFSGSFQGDASQLNVNPFPFTGSGEMQGTLIIESFNDYIDDYVENYFAGTAIESSGDVALTGSIFGAYQNANSFTGSFLNDTGYIILTEVSESLNFANDSAAQAGGVPLGGLYRNGSDIKIRIT